MNDRYLTHLEIKRSIKIIEKLKIPLTIFEVLTVVYIINASKQKVDYHLVEAGALFAKDSTNVFNFPRAQIIVNINKQHLNFLKKKTLDEVIRQKETAQEERGDAGSHNHPALRRACRVDESLDWAPCVSLRVQRQRLFVGAVAAL